MASEKQRLEFDEKGNFAKKEIKTIDWLFDYPVVAKMLKSLKTESTKLGYAIALNHFFRHHNITPDDFLALEEHEIYNLITDYFRHLERIDRTSRARHTKYSLKKLLKRVGRKLSIAEEDDVEHYYKRATTENKHIPTKNEIYKFIDYSNNARNKAFLMCLFQSGLRLGSLAQLTYGMVFDYLYNENNELLELIDKDGNIHPKLPIVLRVSKKRGKNTIKDGKSSKYIVTYFTYLGLESAQLLQEYIEWKKSVEGWEPMNDSLIFTSQAYKIKRNYNEWTEKSQKEFMGKCWRTRISSQTVSWFIDSYAKRIGINPKSIWAHLFRDAFQNHVDYETGVSVFSQVLMGHKLKDGSSSSHYANYNDTKLKQELYMKINWSRSPIERMWQLEKSAKARNHKIEVLEEENLMLKQGLEEQSTTINELKDRVQEIISGDATKRLAIELFAQIFDTEPTETEELYDEDFAMKKKNLRDKMKQAMKLLSED